MQSTYEDKIKGLIPEAVCIELLNKYQTERAGFIRQYRNQESLDRETLLRLIDKIEIGEQ